LSFIIGGGWSLPLGYPNYATTWIEMVAPTAALFVDDSHRDVILNTMSKGMRCRCRPCRANASSTPTLGRWRPRPCISSRRSRTTAR